MEDMVKEMLKRHAKNLQKVKMLHLEFRILAFVSKQKFGIEESGLHQKSVKIKQLCDFGTSQKRL